MKKKFYSFFVVLLFVNVLAVAQPGQIDKTFNPDFGVGSGKGIDISTFETQSQNVSTSAIQSDGKIIFAGSVKQIDDIKTNVVRLNLDGTVDDTFGPVNLPFTDNFSPIVNLIAIQSDGKIIITGTFDRGGIIRLNTDGTIDETFNAGTGPRDANGNQAGVNTMALQADGKLLIASLFTSYNGSQKVNIARLNTDGSLDINFNVGGSGPDRIITSIAVDPDGKIIIGGVFTTYNGTTASGVARLNSDGTLDNTFNVGTGPNSYITEILFQSDGKIILTGSFTTFNGASRWRIVRLTTTGAIDGTFNPAATSGDYAIECARLLPNDKIFIGGNFTNVNGTPISGVALLTANGGLDSSFKPYVGVYGVQTIEAQSDGKVFIGGYFYEVNKTFRSRIARLNADGSLDGGKGADNSIQKLAIQSNQKVIIAGDFKGYNGRARNRIALLNNDGTLDLTFDPQEGANNTVNTFAVQGDGKIIIAGNFTTYRGVTRNRIARVNTDGTLDDTFDPITGANGIIRSVLIDGDGNIIIAGDFTSYNGTARNHIARLLPGGGLDTSFNPGTGADNNIQEAVLQSDGSIIIVGSFLNYNGTSKNRIARLTTTGTLDTSFDTGTGTDGLIGAITIQSDGKILIGGIFSKYNTTDIARIARLNTNGTLDTSFNPGSNIKDLIRTISIQADNKIIVGGDFAKKVARLNSDGTLDETFDSEGSANQSVVTSGIRSDGRILVAGFFDTFNDEVKGRIVSLINDGKREQTITFPEITAKTLGDPAFAPTATATSLLNVSFSPNSDKITITDQLVTMVKPGRAIITANQSGNDSFNAAPPVDISFCINPPKPTVTVTGFNTKNPVVTSSAPEGNQWYVSGSIIEGAVNSTLNITSNGIYYVKVTVDDCISAFSADTHVLVNPDVPTEPPVVTGDLDALSSGVQLSPNPSTDLVEVFGIRGDFVETQLTDMTGRASSITFEKGPQSYRANVQHLTPGIYLLSIQDGNTVNRIKLVKK